jgi:hypothetical protein
MHILQHFLVLFGSMSTTRHNIESIVSHARRLGLHERGTAARYPPSDRADMLRFLTLYCDRCVPSFTDADGSCHATICGTPPFLRRREFETGMPPKPGLGPENFTAQPVLIQLKLLENQVLNDIHSGEVDTSSVEYVLSTEARWSGWMHTYTAEQRRHSHPIVCLTAYIHHHWLVPSFISILKSQE